MNRDIGTWVDNVLVCVDGSFLSVTPEGNLEVRGPGWRKMRGSEDGGNEYMGHDNVRVCKMRSVQRARRIAELIAEFIYKEEEQHGHQKLIE
jgi:hypothetical protein